MRFPDEELLRRWREGNRAAGHELFKRYFDSISRFFSSKNIEGPHCDDLINDVFLGCVEGLPRFRGDASFRTLLYAIARNKLYNYYDRRARERKRFDFASASLHDLGVVAHDQSARTEDKLLLEALQRLPLETQAMLELHYWEGLKIKDLATIFEMPASTVKTRMRKGRLALEGFIHELGRNPQLIRSTLHGLDRWAKRVGAPFRVTRSPQ